MIHLVPRHGFPDVRKNEAPHVLKLILQVWEVVRNERGGNSKRETQPTTLQNLSQQMKHS